MKLSIIIPVYNAEIYLENCISTVTACQESDMEIILVDDGSTDQSLAICQEVERKDPRIQVISKKNEGVSVARNTGMNIAKGNYLMFMDADDYMNEKEWATVWKEIQKDKDFTAFSYYSLYSDGSYKEEPFQEQFENGELDDVYRLLLTTPLLHTCWGKLFRRTIIEQQKIQFPAGVKIGEDYLFVLEYLQYVQSADVVNHPILFYRQNPKGAMGNFQYALRKENVLQVWKYCLEYVKRNHLQKYEKEMCYYQFCSFTYFCRSLAGACTFSQTITYYRELLQDKEIQILLQRVPMENCQKNRKMEYRMIVSKRYVRMAIYFKLKEKMKRLVK